LFTVRSTFDLEGAHLVRTVIIEGVHIGGHYSLQSRFLRELEEVRDWLYFEDGMEVKCRFVVGLEITI
jgi:hypothetical protein